MATAARKPLLVGSVFPNTGDYCYRWFDLQLRYLNASTAQPFDHVVATNDDYIDSPFTARTNVIRVSDTVDEDLVHEHIRGLYRLKQYFVERKDQYDYFLFLDMDAFPVRYAWLKTLTYKAGYYSLAVVLRPENLEQRLHSCVLFVKAAHVQDLEWEYGIVGKNLVGEQERDVVITSHQTTDKRDQCFILLRSNKYQVHPVFCGVYYDMFYHHGGAGWVATKKHLLRSQHYWSHMVKPKLPAAELAEELFEDPNCFIRPMLGWECGYYVNI